MTRAGSDTERIRRVFVNAAADRRQQLEQEMRSHLVRVDDIEEAQLEIDRMVRQLEEAGKITAERRDNTGGG